MIEKERPRVTPIWTARTGRYGVGWMLKKQDMPLIAFVTAYGSAMPRSKSTPSTIC